MKAKIEKEIEDLTKVFKDLEMEKTQLIEDANNKAKQLSQKQGEVNTSIVKNQGKLELLNETEQEKKRNEVTSKK